MRRINLRQPPITVENEDRLHELKTSREVGRAITRQTLSEITFFFFGICRRKHKGKCVCTETAMFVIQ